MTKSEDEGEEGTRLLVLSEKSHDTREPAGSEKEVRKGRKAGKSSFTTGHPLIPILGPH